jgi:hypothetical protein
LNRCFVRATEGIRTLDLTITNRLLYQLSYGGLLGGEIIQDSPLFRNLYGYFPGVTKAFDEFREQSQEGRIGSDLSKNADE